MKVLSLFSGIGAFEKALDVLKIPYELVGYCEIDKYASKSYSAIHDVPETMNLGDITKIDEKALPKDIDLITYGFPCQDISLAGKQKGLFNEDGSQTRSGLFFEALRIIEETQPRVAIAENVKNLTGKKFNAQFQVVLASLEAAGYNNYWQVLNAKDYGIPQNRERVFIVSIRKDIDTGSFKFPEPFPLELRLKDMLEDEVDEKFYLDGKFENITKVNENYSIMNGGIIGKMHDISRRVYSENATAPTIPTCAGGNIQPKVAVAMRGRYNEDGKVEQHIEISDRELANALTTVQKDSLIGEPVIVEDFYKNRDVRIYEETAPTLRGERTGLKVAKTNLHIRKLTPKECFRLMGFSDEDFAKAEAVNSNTQLYKQAGNSIVVDVIAHILKGLKGVLMNES
jgi:DNA (cytosine-5)-methyltransferase 1